MADSGQTTGSWVPPFCPNPECPHHRNCGQRWPFKKLGFYRRQLAPHRIQRFTCKDCRRSFSTQTFSTSYWQKRPDLDARLLMRTVGCMANRQIARDLKVSPETVNRHLARLGRHCLLYHRQAMQDAPAPTAVVIDGLESFELSQYHPMHHHVAVEKDTDFFIYFTDSELRRKGRMTAAQRRRRQDLERQLGRPDPQAIAMDMRELLAVVFAGQDRGLVYSDDHPAYRKSLLGLGLEQRVTPGTAHRDRHNALWEVNLLELVIRHGSANHKRETIAWSKRRQASAERLAILLVWRNYMQGRRQKQRGSPTPAMQRGMRSDRLTIGELLAKRLFRTRIALPPRWEQYYDRTVWTRGLARQRPHRLTLAY